MCDEHRPKRPSAHAQGYGVEWRKLRARVPKTPCAHCEAPWGVGFHLDHKQPRRRRIARGLDPDAISNLQWLCPSCHSIKTVREQDE